MASASASIVPPTFRRPSMADLIRPFKLYPPLGKRLGCSGASLYGQKHRKTNNLWNPWRTRNFQRGLACFLCLLELEEEEFQGLGLSV